MRWDRGAGGIPKAPAGKDAAEAAVATEVATEAAAGDVTGAARSRGASATGWSTTATGWITTTSAWTAWRSAWRSWSPGAVAADGRAHQGRNGIG